MSRLYTIHQEYQEHPVFAPLRARTRFVPGEGSYPYPLVMFVGEAPGATEELKGRPFVGMAGKLLRRCAVRAGFNDDSWWITNIVKYRPPGNRPPSPEEAAAARPFLRREVAAVDAEVVVPLGRHALSVLLPNEPGGITALHGKLVIPNQGRRLYYPLLHPSAVLRGAVSQDLYAAKFLQLRELLG